MRLPHKDPSESKLVRFQFKGDVEPGATITAADVTITVDVGVDASAAQVLDGPPVINAAALEVLQRVTLGQPGCDYSIRCVATDSAGLKHLVAVALPVRTFIVRDSGLT
jgi:hypothetical protein